MSKKNPEWSRDELILALDLYFNIDFPNNTSNRNNGIEELSELLNSLPIHEAHFRGIEFRNPSGVYMKLCNFLRLDPNYTGKGLGRGSKLDEVVWNEFASNVPKLHKTAQLIREELNFMPETQQPIAEPSDDEEFPEGRILTRLHNVRERNAALTRKKKEKVLKETGKLECEICSFDFSVAYGELGYGYAECHHTVSLSSLKPGHKTKLSELAIVCANCHRMIYRSRVWLSIEEMKKIVKPRVNSS